MFLIPGGSKWIHMGPQMGPKWAPNIMGPQMGTVRAPNKIGAPRWGLQGPQIYGSQPGSGTGLSLCLVQAEPCAWSRLGHVPGLVEAPSLVLAELQVQPHPWPRLSLFQGSRFRYFFGFVFLFLFFVF